MRERLLTQHFLQRFLENDLLSPDADRHDAIAMVCGVLLTLGLFLSVMMSMKFLFMPFQSPGRTALLALGDRLTFSAIAMVVMALVAVMAWDALSLDPRDTAIFGTLPIHRAVIVRAKLRAIGLMAGGFALAISSLSSLFHPALMVVKLPVGVLLAVALVAIHLTVMLAASLFAFASVFALREAARALLGSRFARISAALQAVLIVGLVTIFLLLPAILNRAGRPEQRAARMLPPVWFVGLHDVLAGDAVADLPRGRMPPSVASEEDRDAARYRALARSIRPLAWRAVAGLGISLSVAIGGFFWNARRLPLPVVGRRTGRYRGPGLLARAMALTALRHPATQAGFYFTLHCLFRSGPHRVVIAACTAVSTALAVVLLATASRVTGGVWSIPVSVLATQPMVMSIMVAGFRHVTRVPADIRANRMFRLAWVADSSRFVAGVRRGAFTGVVLPAVVLLLPAHLYLIGLRPAAMHGVCGLLVGAALVSILTFRTSRLPFVAGYAPASDLNTIGPVVLVGGPIAVALFAQIERVALAGLWAGVVLCGILTAIVLLPAMADHNEDLDLPTAFDAPPAGATRLDLD